MRTGITAAPATLVNTSMPSRRFNVAHWNSGCPLRRTHKQGTSFSGQLTKLVLRTSATERNKQNYSHLWVTSHGVLHMLRPKDAINLRILVFCLETTRKTVLKVISSLVPELST